MMQESIVRFFYDLANPVLDTIMPVLTMMGEEYFVLIFATWFLWNMRKKDSLVMIFSMFIAILFTNVIKNVFMVRRPFQVLQGIDGKRLQTATGYSFPSGHTQCASSLFLTLAVIFKKPIVWLVSILLTLVVALSRIYLGVHWPMDVIASIIIAVFFAIFSRVIVEKYWENPQALRIVFRIILVIGFLLSAFFLMMDFFVWRGRFYISDIIKLCGLTVGSLSALYMLETGCTYSPEGVLWKKIVRWLLGIGTTAALLAGLKKVLPQTDVFYFLRYSLVGVWAFLIYPIIAMKIKLFDVLDEGYLCLKVKQQK